MATANTHCSNMSEYSRASANTHAYSPTETRPTGQHHGRRWVLNHTAHALVSAARISSQDTSEFHAQRHPRQAWRAREQVTVATGAAGVAPVEVVEDVVHVQAPGELVALPVAGIAQAGVEHVVGRHARGPVRRGDIDGGMAPPGQHGRVRSERQAVVRVYRA